MAQLEEHDPLSGGNPYVGPRTFKPGEILFGRDRETRDLTALIISHRLVLFYAPSGAGKSSLINTKIAPNLSEQGFELLPVARVGGHSYPDDAQNVFTYNLIAGLHQEKDLPQKFSTLPLPEFLDNLVQDGGEYLYDDQFTYKEGEALKPRVLIVDQFEEILTTNTEYADHRAGFFQQLNEALTIDPYLWIVLAMRDDFIAGLDPYLHHLPDRLRHRFYMQRLNREAAMEATCRPAAEAGRPFEEGASDLLVDNLRLIKSSSDGENKYLEYVEPVQLQAVCFQMWEKLRDVPGDVITVADVEQYADVDMALTSFYEQTIAETVAQTGVSEIDLRNWFEKWFITDAGTRDMVFRGRELTGDLPTTIADEVRRRFILRSVVRQEGIWYELVHDRLVGPIKSANRHWRLDQPLLGLAQHWEDADHSPERLLDGRQLDRFLSTDWKGLGPLVAAFVEASMEVRRQEQEREAALKEVDRQQKLEQQRALAAAEKARADSEHARAEESEKAKIRQRWLMGIVIFLLIIGAIVTSYLAYQALNQAALARTNEQTANKNADVANRNAAAAYVEATRAADNLSAAKEAEKTANEERLRADQNAQEVNDLLALIEVQALIDKTTSLRVGSHANDELAVLLGIEALRLNKELTAANRTPASRVNTALRNVLQIKDFSAVIADEDFLINSVDVSADGRYLAAAGSDNAIRLYDLSRPGSPPQLLEGLFGEPSTVTFAPNGSMLAASGFAEIALWDVADLNAPPQNISGHEAWITDVAFSPDGRQLVSVGDDWQAMVWDLDDLEQPQQILPGQSGFSSVAYAPDGQLLATGDNFGQVQLWNLDEEEPAGRNLGSHLDIVSALAFAPDGQTLASGSYDTEIRLWAVNDPENKYEPLRGHQGAVLDLDFSPDGSLLASAADDNNIHLWDRERSSGVPNVLRAHSAPVSGVSFLPDNSSLFSGSGDGTIRQWDLANSNQEPLVLRGHQDWVRSIAMSGDGSTLASASDDGSVRLWNLDDPGAPPRILSHNDWVNAVAFSADGRLLATGTNDGLLRVWDVARPERSPEIIEGHQAWINAVAFSRDGRKLVTADGNGWILLWNPNDLDAGFEELGQLENQEVFTLAVSNDSSKLAGGSSSGKILIWDLAYPGRSPIELDGHDGEVNGLAFSPDGSYLASGGGDAQVYLWDLLQPGSEPQSLPGHSSWVTAVAFSPDGKYLASGSGDTTIRLWDMADLSAEPQLLEGHTDTVQSVAFSSDGGLLASGSTDSTVRLWRTGEKELIDFACRRLPRNLTWQESHAHLITENNYHVTCPLLPLHPTVAEGLAGQETAERQKEIEVFMAELWGEFPSSANELTKQLPGALAEQAYRQALNGQVDEALALMKEARAVDGKVNLQFVGTALAKGWGDWQEEGRTARIQSFAAELAQEYPDAGAEFLEQIPFVLVLRAAGLAFEGEPESDDEAISLIADARELDPQGELSGIGLAFGDSWPERDWQSRERLPNGQKIAEALEELDQGAAQLFRETTAEFLAARAVDVAWEGDSRQALDLAADATIFDPQVDASDVGFSLGYNWLIDNEDDRLAKIEAFAAELDEKVPSAAPFYRQQMASELINHASNLVWDGERDAAFVVVDEAQLIDENVPATPVGHALALNWDEWEGPDRLLRVASFLEELRLEYPQIAEGFQMSIPQRFISHAVSLIYDGEGDEALQIAAEAQELDDSVASFELGVAFAESWEEWESENRLQRVQGFATELESQFPEAAANFLATMPFMFQDRASAAAEVGERENALELLRELQQLAPDFDLSYVGNAFAFGLGSSEADDLQEEIALLDEEISVEFPTAAAVYRESVPFVLANKAYDLALNGEVERSFTLMEMAKALLPELDLSGHGQALGQSRQNWDALSLGADISSTYARLAALDPLAAGQYQIALASALVDQAHQLAFDGQADEALAISEVIKGLDKQLWAKTADDMIISTATGLVRRGDVPRGLQIFNELKAAKPGLVVTARQYNRFCWFGAVWGFANDVISACNRAVASQPENGNYVDSRGVARALQGDFEAAAADFQFYIFWAIETGADEERIERRREWIAELEQGRNPFDAQLLEELRDE